MNLVGARWLARIEVCVSVLAGLGASACNLDNPGITAPEHVLAFPVGLALSPSPDDQPPRYLYVVNANVDLSYNSGSVHAYDLDKLAARIEGNGCRAALEPSPELDAGLPDAGDAGVPDAAAEDAELPDAAAEDAETLDGEVLDPDGEVLDGEVPDPDADAPDEADAGDDAGETLDAEVDALVPVVEVPARPPTAAPGRTELCDGRRRADGERSLPEDESSCCFGAASALNDLRSGQVSINSFASGVAVSPDGRHVYVPVRTDSRLLYIDAADDGTLSCGGETGRCRRGVALGEKGDPNMTAGFPTAPKAVVVGNLSQLDPDLTDDFVATVHENGALSLFSLIDGRPVLKDVITSGPLRSVSLTFDPASRLLYVSSTALNTIERVGVRRLDRADNLSTPYLYRSDGVILSGLTSTFDVRDVVLDSRPVMEPAPIRAYALVRGSGSGTIQSLVFVELPAGADGRFAKVIDEVRLANEPSKLVQADLGGRHLLFASCYDGGAVYIIDADTRTVVTVVREVSGPFDMQVDEKRELLYVTDYAASVVRVVDLGGLSDVTRPRPRVVATLGAPYFPGGFQ